MFKINDFSSFWGFVYMPLFSWYSCKPKNTQLENTDAKKKFKSFLWSLHWKAKNFKQPQTNIINFFLEGILSFFLSSSQQRLCPFVKHYQDICSKVFGGFKVPVIWAFNSQRILSWNENLLLDFLSFNVRVRVLYMCWIEIQ